jgi:pyruvate,water dikinase
MASSELIAWFADIGLSDRPTVGGKGGSLGELTRAGLAPPPGFVVRTAAFERFIEALEKQGPIRAKVEALRADDLSGIAALSGELRTRLEAAELPRDVQGQIAEAYAELCGGSSGSPAAVRSSATTEDAEDASFAGLQDTYLSVIGADSVLKHVRSCWASLYSEPSIAYRRKRRVAEEGIAMAVVVQRMVDARTAGVMFTRSPTTGDKSVVAIEGAWGLGSAVVGGEVTPDRFVVAKITGEITVRDISDKSVEHAPAEGGGVRTVAVEEKRRLSPCLSDEELIRLKEIARNVERHYGMPQDIEWAIDRAGAILILQSRPETVWSAKEHAPVAKPADDPIAHVMNIFGGRR